MNKTKKIVFSGVLAAFVFIATVVVKIEIPGGGYFNLGDTTVIISGVILGPLFSFFAAAIGSMLADLCLGYAIYAPASFLIKGIMALVVALMYGKNKRIFMSCAGAFISEIIMVCGYFLYEIILTNNTGTALLGIPGNLTQGAVCFVASILLIILITKNKLINRLINLD
jgi:uncharacterized membrane protein